MPEVENHFSPMCGVTLSGTSGPKSLSAQLKDSLVSFPIFQVERCEDLVVMDPGQSDHGRREANRNVSSLNGDPYMYSLKATETPTRTKYLRRGGSVLGSCARIRLFPKQYKTIPYPEIR